MTKLRDYQIRAIAELYKALKVKKRVIWCLPTGAGKSTIGSRFVQACVKSQKRVLFFVHSKELVEQFANRLWHQFGIPCGVIMAGVKPDDKRMVQVASVMSLVRRKKPSAEVVIIDEAHRSKAKTYQKIIEVYPDARIVGLTATPFRGDGRGLGQIFEEIVHPVKLTQLISDGYLVGTNVFAPATAVNLSGIKIKRGDFDITETFARYNDAVAYNSVVESYKEHADGTKAIVFNINVAHSKLQTEAFNRANIPAAHLDGETGKAERAKIVKEFAAGKWRILNNVNLFTEGFDVPDTQTVILNRPTKSLGLYVQQVGRGLRPSDGKEKCIVLDHAGNTLRHGFVEDYDLLPFSLDDKAKVKSNDKEDAPTRECPTCHFINPRARKVCKNCGYEFPIEKMELSTRKGESLIVMDRDAMIVERLQAMEWRQVKKLPLHLLEIYEIINGYKYGWHIHRAIDSGAITGLELDDDGLAIHYTNNFKIAKFQIDIETERNGTKPLIRKLRQHAKKHGIFGAKEERKETETYRSLIN